MASEYLKWKYRDVKPDEPVTLTSAEKRKNWWHYHKWHVFLGIVLLVSLASIGWHAMGLGETLPDYRIAYVGTNPLPDDTVSAIENVFASLGEDLNGDKKVSVLLTQYVADGRPAGMSELFFPVGRPGTVPGGISFPVPFGRFSPGRL